MNARSMRLVTAALAVLTTSWFFGEIILHPDRHMFAPSGDGIKNYFTFAWHVRHDPSWLRFGGMNMPYGEHVGFTDGHALLSLLAGWIPWVQQYPVGTLNLLMILAFPLSMWLIYELCLRHGMLPWIAAAAAWCTVWMTPQLFRLEGHFSLSYMFWLPLLLWLCSPRSKKAGWLRHVNVSVAIAAAFFIHPYHGMMMSVFVVSLAAVKLLFLRSEKAQWPERGWEALSAVLPVVLFFAVMRLTDPHPERTDQTYGFLHYKASYDSVFVPHHPPFRHLVSQVIPVRGQEWEGWAYIGLFTMLTGLTALVLFAVRRFWFGEIPETLRLFFLASVPLLFFSFAWPFLWGPASWLDALPVVKQFRAPGRFAWPFYYASVLFSFSILHAWWKRPESGMRLGLRWMMTLLGIGVFVAEAFPPLREVKAHISLRPNYFRQDTLPEDLRAQADDLRRYVVPGDAWVPLPYFHYGSDRFGRIPGEEFQAWAMILAYHSGVPMAASALSRASLPESRIQLSRFRMSDPGVATSGQGAGWLVRPPSLPALEWDEEFYWNIASAEEGAGLTMRRYRRPAPEQLSWSDLQGGSLQRKEGTSGVITLRPGAYLVLASCSRDSVPSAEVYPHLRLSLSADPVHELTALQLIVQQHTPGGLRWILFHPLGQSSGFSETRLTETIPVLPDEGGGDIEVVLYHNGARPVSFRSGELKWVTRR
jgi:hypothetical protein